MSLGRWTRGLLLVALASVQAFAATGELLHLCRMREDVRTCKCPHPKGDAPRAPEGHDGPEVKGAACCDRHVIPAAPALATVERPSAFLALAPPSAEDALGAIRLDGLERPSRWRTSPPSHGPPLYLTIRTLLI